MERRVRKRTEDVKLNNRGSALIMVLTVIALISILGALSMSTALLNVKMRALNRGSDKNFYELETALDEIYAQTGRMCSEILKEQYAEVLGKLYVTYQDNDEANEALKKGFMEAFANQMLGEEDTRAAHAVRELADGENRGVLTEKLKGMSATFSGEKAAGLRVSVESVVLNRESVSEENSPYSGVSFDGLCLTYTNPEMEMESALTVDLHINVPLIRFINGGDTMLDYVAVANGGIEINEKGKASIEAALNGNIYGDYITVENAGAEVNANLMTAAGMLTVKQTGKLTVGPAAGAEERKESKKEAVNEAEEEARAEAEAEVEAEAEAETEESGPCSVWASGIELRATSELEANDADFYIKDDLTLQENDNKVRLNGSYYGYGNEGSDKNIIQKTPAMSSAIIINDKNSRVDLSELDSLMLAGRAYLNFGGGTVNGSDVYPMGESFAVKATQGVYLIPATDIVVDGNPAGTNPVLLPQKTEAYTAKIQIKKDHTGAAVGEGAITVTVPPESETADRVSIVSSYSTAPAVPVYLKEKLYLFYNFDTLKQRSEFFERYLKNNVESFESLLRKSEVTGKDGNGIFNEDGQIITSGSLYQVSGDNGQQSFRLLRSRREDSGSGEDTGSANADSSNTFKWVDLGRQLSDSFENIKKNLAESMRMKAPEAGNVPPLGTYVKLGELLPGKTVSEKGESCAAFLSGSDVTIDLKKGTVSSRGETEEMTGGLVLSSGNVTVAGDGEFNGLILAGGKISITGDAVLTADPDTYFPLLEEDSEIRDYFYGYDGNTSDVMNHYEDFVIRENWKRSGLESGGGTK